MQRSTYMPGSKTTQGRAGARFSAHIFVAFRYANSGGIIAPFCSRYFPTRINQGPLQSHTNNQPLKFNNVPDPLLARKELPTFKFALDKSEAKTVGKNVAREAR
jgi:hypothetical protein